jgi:hypothetical protein
MRFILLYKIEVTDRHPVATGICGACVTVLLLCIGHAWGWL